MSSLCHRQDLRLLMAVMTLFVSHVVSTWGQCSPPQAPPNCDDCKVWNELNITVCHAGTDYNATIEVCTQFAVPPNPIDNPCTVPPDYCARAVDAITWVRSICVDQDLKDIGEPALLQAIVKGTNLCCPTGNFLGVVLPACTPGVGCKESTAAFCHILAMPRCMTKNRITGCYDKCLDCKDFCMIERRYCKPTPTSCCKHFVTTCSYNEDDTACAQFCDREWNCSANYFNGSSEVCCD